MLRIKMDKLGLFNTMGLVTAKTLERPDRTGKISTQQAGVTPGFFY
jgi:hypothetical protein